MCSCSLLVRLVLGFLIDAETPDGVFGVMEPFLFAVVAVDVAVADEFSKTSDFAMGWLWKAVELVLLD